MRRPTIISSLFLLLICHVTLAQQDTIENQNDIDSNAYFLSTGSKTFVRDSLGIWPKQIKVGGKIQEYSNGYSCGSLCSAGAVRLTLTKKPRSYKSDELFLVIPCLSEATDEILGVELNLTVYVLDMNVDKCFYLGSVSIDSKGIPFYYPENHELLKIKTGGNNK